MSTTFGQVIRQARADKGYSQRELAMLVEIDFTYLSKLESDSTEYPPKEYVIQQLAYYLDLDCEELMAASRTLVTSSHELGTPYFYISVCYN